MTVDVRGKRFGVLGAARSGVAAAGLLAKHGAEVFLSDRGQADKFGTLPVEFESKGVQFEFGQNSLRVLEVDTLVLSPGVPTDAPIVKQAIEMGVNVISEIELSSWFCPAPIVAITGTNGKTTTTTLAGRIFADAGMPHIVAGNIGTAFAQLVEQLGPDGTAVLEISSFQLDHIRTFRPAVAAILNITPDHLDRYDHSFEKYAASKLRVFENQEKGDVLVYNDDDGVTRDLVLKQVPGGVSLLPFSTNHPLERGAWVRDGQLAINVGGQGVDVIPVNQIGIVGEHNIANAMAAALIAAVRSVPVESIRTTLETFRGVEHRLEFVRDLDGVRYVNDSKATNVDSVWYALRSYDRPLIVLIGGRDKGNDYGRLSDLVRKHVKAVVAIGESSKKVMDAFSPVVTTVKAQSMKEAVDTARGLAARGDIVLLSPACASFDWYKNYEHRGQIFKEIVNALKPAS